MNPIVSPMILIRVIFFLIYIALAIIFAPIIAWIFTFGTLGEAWKAMSGKKKKKGSYISKDRAEEAERQAVYYLRNKRDYWN